ncbi:MAG: sulfatase-like hydrolase/transferase [Methylacidiphilales bacterium]|nr:sulfatase-like hydrolase/transferase [Candidatus Methylacidiphilales bacterium]
MLRPFFKPLSPLVLVLGVNLYFVLVLSAPIFSQFTRLFPVAGNGIEGYARLGLFGISAFFYNVIFIWFCYWPMLWLRITLAGLFVLGGFIDYYTSVFGICIDKTMIANAFNTDVNETLELLHAGALINTFLFGILPAIFILLVPIQQVTNKNKLLTMALLPILSLVLVIGVLLIPVGAHRMFHVILSATGTLSCALYPSNVINSSIRHGISGIEEFWLSFTTKEVTAPDAQVKNLHSNTLPTVMILVIGETARAKSYSLNGYPRATNPYLSKQSVISFTNASSCGTQTIISVPCIFSEFGNHRQYRSTYLYTNENLLHVLMRVGVSVFWLSNNSIFKRLLYDIPHAKFGNHPSYPCIAIGCYDQQFISDLKVRMQSIKQQSSSALLVYHLYGSHFDYDSRTPQEFKQFNPICPKGSFSTCSVEQITNSYDSTILYNDYVLAHLIEELKPYTNSVASVLLYTSDHGESLGEQGNFAHGLPYSYAPVEQTNVPFILWYSKSFEQSRKIDLGCLNKKIASPISHQNIFHTTFWIFGIESKSWQPDLNIFNCAVQ